MRIQDIGRALSISSAALAPANTAYQASHVPFTWNGVLQPAPKQLNLLMQYNMQDPVLSARMGQNLFYDYDLLQTDSNSNAIVAGLNNASADGAWTGNTLRINTIPDQVYIYIKPRKSQFIAGGNPDQATITDSFLRITGLKVNYNNKTNLLSSCTESDLYRMSTKNGVKMSWHEWKFGVGSLVCIDVCSDLGLGSDEAAGQNKFNTLQICGTFSCSPLAYAQNGTATLYDVMTVVVTQDKAVISPSKADFTIGGVSQTEVLALSTSKDNVIPAGMREAAAVGRGGSFLGKMGKTLNKGLHVLKQVKPEHIQMAQDGLKSLGLGVVFGEVVGGRLEKSKHKRVL